MLCFVLVPCLIVLATAPLFAQQMEDVVYLKNGEIVWGTIVEQIPGESLKIQTADGSVFTYAMDEISKIVKESVMGTEESATGIEIGTLFGLSHLFSNGEGITTIGVPRAPVEFFGNSSLYVSWFPNEQLAIGPEFSFGRFSLDGDGITSLYLGGRGAFFLQSNAMSSPYILGHGALLVINDSDFESESDFSIGAGLGYQWRLGSALVLRAEGRYQYWFDVEVNDFSFLLGLGTRAGRVGTEKDAPASEVEIGTLFGLSRRVVDLDWFFGSETVTLTYIGVPAAAPNPLSFHLAHPPYYIPSLYVLWFPNEKLSIGPEFSFGRVSENRVGITSLYLGGRGAFSLRTNKMSGPYILGLGALATVAGDGTGFDESETDFSAGAGLGYQWRLGSALVLRAEGRYRRWFNEEINDLSLIIGLGTRLGGR